jgi:hypothetical protein
MPRGAAAASTMYIQYVHVQSTSTVLLSSSSGACIQTAEGEVGKRPPISTQYSAARPDQGQSRGADGAPDASRRRRTEPHRHLPPTTYHLPPTHCVPAITEYSVHSQVFGMAQCRVVSAWMVEDDGGPWKGGELCPAKTARIVQCGLGKRLPITALIDASWANLPWFLGDRRQLPGCACSKNTSAKISPT